MTTWDQVVAAHRAHPDWTARDIAASLGCLPEYVSATARRRGLTLPSAWDEKRRQRAERDRMRRENELLGAAARAAGFTLESFTRRAAS